MCRVCHPLIGHPYEVFMLLRYYHPRLRTSVPFIRRPNHCIKRVANLPAPASYRSVCVTARYACCRVLPSSVPPTPADHPGAAARCPSQQYIPASHGRSVWCLVLQPYRPSPEAVNHRTRCPPHRLSRPSLSDPMLSLAFMLATCTLYVMCTCTDVTLVSRVCACSGHM